MSTSTTPLPAAVLWDMDGTILDTEPLWDIAMIELAARRGLQMTPELRESTLGNAMTDALTRVYDAAGLPGEKREYMADARWLLDRVAELFGDGLPWRPGAPEALELVTVQGVPMALVTNTVRELTDVALDTIGVGRFSASVCGDEVARAKPHPDPYLRAAALLGVEPAQCLVIEDSPTGAAAAAAAGIPALVVPSAAPVDPASGRTLRPTLTGLTAADLAVAAAATPAR
ncbi:HAD family hydrolase [Gordonia sinesedis]